MRWDVPDVLQRALEGDARALAGWNALSPGKRRGLAHRVASARTVPTRLRRLDEVLVALREGEVV
jgi:uncharacterized protein YdeI (YjbR/CyaY-like superfamily)